MFLIYYLFSDDLMLPRGGPILVKDYDCYEPVKKPYYSCGHVAICIQCGEYLEYADEESDTYTQCIDCTQREMRKRQI